MLLKIELSLMIKFLPNIITVFRIILVPFFVYFLISDIYHGKLIALLIFTIASLSDMIDGKLARKYNIITKFGTFMDPLADKILVVSALFVFVFFKIFPLWMLVVIIVRDFLITSLRIFMENNGQMMQTSNLGKLKTVAQFISINFILLCLIFINYNFSVLITFINNYSIIYILMFITTVFTAITGFDYFVKNHKMIKLIILKK